MIAAGLQLGTIDLGPYSVIILRDDDEEIRAFHNVCRHTAAA